jgi:uncharacterized membrane protein YbhN (UPF0104 family)
VRGGVAGPRSEQLPGRAALAGVSRGFVGPALPWLLPIAGVLAVGVAARGRLGEAAARLGDERPAPLLLAAACAAAVPLATTAAWRSALASRGGGLGFGESWSCYGLGSLANAVLPAKLGEVARIEAFARRLPAPRRRLVAGGASALVGLTQAAALALILAAGAAAGALPAWAAAPALALVPAALCVRATASRGRAGGKVAGAVAAVALSPGAWVRVAGWVAVAAVARLAAIGAVLASLHVHHPVDAAVVAVGAQALGNVVPLAPGGAGVPAAAMALGLTRFGLGGETATAAALSFHAVETCTSAAFGLCGLALARRGVSLPGQGAPRRRLRPRAVAVVQRS